MNGAGVKRRPPLPLPKLVARPVGPVIPANHAGRDEHQRDIESAQGHYAQRNGGLREAYGVFVAHPARERHYPRAAVSGGYTEHQAENQDGGRRDNQYKARYLAGRNALVQRLVIRTGKVAVIDRHLCKTPFQ